MPALSPTMTEGNIAAWRVKEGDKFAAGDVLLEIETDKATMDVEAQDDGIMFKILTGDGAKGVPVGARIGVTAEDGDDIATLEVPADDAAAAPQPPQQAAAAPAAPEPPQTDSVPREDRTASGHPPANPAAAAAAKQTYPLYPSIVQLLHEHGIDAAKADEIPATGPKGRLLKGDVLVYLGKAKPDAAANGQAVYDRLAHLDLSNIKVAEKKNQPKAAAAPTEKKPAVEEAALQVALPISLKEVIEAQKKVQDTLDVFIPLSTFVARAMEVANDELPLPKDYKPSADELFNQVLGLDKVGRQGSRGHYVAQISALSPVPSLSQTALKTGKPDIIDLLAGPGKKQPAKTASRPSGLSTGVNLFTLKVSKAEEKRAKTFLERVKLVLENEPGRLVL